MNTHSPCRGDLLHRLASLLNMCPETIKKALADMMAELAAAQAKALKEVFESEWLRRMAEKEANGIVSAGGLVASGEPTNESPGSLLVTMEEFAQLVRVSTRQVKRWLAAGDLPEGMVVRTGSRGVRFSRPEIEAWLRAGGIRRKTGKRR